MAGLAETISRLAQFRGLSQPGAMGADDRLTDIEDFGSNPGQLRARVYIPSSLPVGAPLVVVLHGCTQTAAGYDANSGWSDLADEYGFALLFPEQRRANNPNLCFNWFQPQHIQRDQGEAHSISQMVKAVQAQHGIDRSRIFVTGLSAGGAMASVMLATYPDIFAGGAVIAGLPYGVARSVQEALGAMQGQANIDATALAAKVKGASSHRGPWPILSVWHGSADRTVAASNGNALVEQWRALHELPALPGEAGSVEGFSRRSWHDAAGRAVLEEIVVPGMGHGTPIATSGEDNCGSSAAYMLDVGISSTHEICRFWKIAGADVVKAKRSRPASEKAAASKAIAVAASAAQPRLTREKAPPRKPVEAGVDKVIKDALRAAGLLR